MNPHKGEVTLEAGGETYTLRLAANALVIAEELLDKGVEEIAGMLSDAANFRLGTARALLFAGLREHHPKLSLEDAGEIIGEIGIPAVLNKLGESMQAAFPQPEGEDKNPPKGAKAGTGPRS